MFIHFPKHRFQRVLISFIRMEKQNESKSFVDNANVDDSIVHSSKLNWFGFFFMAIIVFATSENPITIEICK